MFGWFKKSAVPVSVEEDPQDSAPETETVTIREYLHSLGSLDTSALAEKGRGNWSECPIDSPNGQAMIAVIDACQALVNLCPDLSEGERWEIWFQVGRQLEVFYFD